MLNVDFLMLNVDFGASLNHTLLCARPEPHAVVRKT